MVFLPPKSSIKKQGFSIIFTIHFGGRYPYFWFNTHLSSINSVSNFPHLLFQVSDLPFHHLIFDDFRFWKPIHLTYEGIWDHAKSLNSIFPTKDAIPKSWKVSPVSPKSSFKLMDPSDQNQPKPTAWIPCVQRWDLIVAFEPPDFLVELGSNQLVAMT